MKLKVDERWGYLTKKKGFELSQSVREFLREPEGVFFTLCEVDEKSFFIFLDAANDEEKKLVKLAALPDWVEGVVILDGLRGDGEERDKNVELLVDHLEEVDKKIAAATVVSAACADGRISATLDGYEVVVEGQRFLVKREIVFDDEYMNVNVEKL